MRAQSTHPLMRQWRGRDRESCGTKGTATLFAKGRWRKTAGCGQGVRRTTRFAPKGVPATSDGCNAAELGNENHCRAAHRA